MWISSLPLRAQVALFFGTLIAVLSAGLSHWLAERHASTALNDQGATLETLARSTSLVLADGLFERQREVELLAADPPGGARDAVEARLWNPALKRMQSTRSHYSWIGVTDAQGTVQASTGNLLLGQDVSARPWFQAARTRPFTGDVHPAKLLAALLPPSITGEPPRFLDFAAPLRNRQGEVIGVLGVHASWDWANEVIASLRNDELRQAGVRVFVLDREGMVIHRPRDATATERPLQPPDSKQAQRTPWSDGQSYLSVGIKLPNRNAVSDLGWTVVVRQPLHRAERAADQVRREALLAGALATLVGMVLVAWLAARFSRPLKLMADTARRIEGGELQAAIPRLTLSPEVRQLSEALSGMKDSLIEREVQLEHRVQQRTEELAQAHTKLRQANEVLSALALKDALTGLNNRRAADARMELEFQRHRRNGQPLALALIDVDHFKRVNDRFGHPVGDQVLQRVAAQLSNCLRTTDFLARFGGEEFLVLMPETPPEAAAQVAERMRQLLESDLTPPAPVTLSIGMACPAQHHEDLRAALQAADEALYAAKQTGRNRVVSAPEPLQSLHPAPQESP